MGLTADEIQLARRLIVDELRARYDYDYIGVIGQKAVEELHHMLDRLEGQAEEIVRKALLTPEDQIRFQAAVREPFRQKVWRQINERTRESYATLRAIGEDIDPDEQAHAFLPFRDVPEPADDFSLTPIKSLWERLLRD